MHAEWTDLMSAYLDDELDAVSRRRLEAHLTECPACAATLADLGRIVVAAPGYEGTTPGHDLWPGIARTIESRRVVALPVGRRRFQVRWTHLAVAAVVMMAVGAAGATWLLGGRAVAPVTAIAPPASTDSAITLPAAVGVAAYDQAVAELERSLAANRDRLDTATVRVLESSLRAIDQAIAEARAAIQRDSANQYLNGQIAANLRKKVNLLRFATSAIASET